MSGDTNTKMGEDRDTNQTTVSNNEGAPKTEENETTEKMELSSKQTTAQDQEKDNDGGSEPKEEPQSSSSSSEPNNKKRNNNTNKSPSTNGSGSNPPQQKKQKKMKNHRRRDNPEWDDKPQHAGSYAVPAMQKLFPSIIVPPPPPQRDDTTNNNGGDNDNDETSVSSVAPGNKYPKRKVALVVGFLGTKYAGMQININQRTLQAEIELGLYKANLLSYSNFGYPHKYSWSNAARTDKGVHACAQVCSVKIQLPPTVMETNKNDDDDKEESGWEDRAREALNANLPEDIKILDLVRVTKNFCAKTQRDKVRYQYCFPSYLLLPRDELRQLFTDHLPPECREGKDPPTQTQLQTLFDKLKSYRATAEQIASLREALQKFEGTRSFHNYTNHKPASDPSAMRYIMSFKVNDPLLISPSDGVEWIPMTVLGQSFLLHQIRKMSSVAIDVARGACPLSHVPATLDSQHTAIVGIAPAQGLFLEMSYFDLYNKRQQRQSVNLMNWLGSGRDVERRWMDFRRRWL